MEIVENGMRRTWDPFWISAFQTEFVPELNAIVDVFENRLLPNLKEGEIAEESQRIQEEAFERFMSMPGTGEEGPSVIAEKAETAGISHYILMNGIRQGMLNLSATMLFHAFEHQVISFHRNNVLSESEENDPEQFKLSVFQCRLKECGIDIGKFPSWPKIYDELRLVANAVKHAEGSSSHKLRKIRPDIFQNPHFSGFSEFLSGLGSQVFQPLVRDGLYVSVQDIKDYRDHLVRFWSELADAMKCT